MNMRNGAQANFLLSYADNINLIEVILMVNI